MDNKAKEKRKKLMLELFHDELYVPMRRKELAIFMQVSEENRADFDSIVDELLNEHLIEQTKRGKLVLKGRGSSDGASFKESKREKGDDKPAIIGTYIGNAKGFGFVEVEGMDSDFFIPEGYNLNACHNDKVEIQVLNSSKKQGNRTEAKVVRVIERSTDAIVGTYQASKNFGFVVTDNAKFSNDIFIAKENSKGAVDGHKVLVEILDYGDERHNPEGKIVEIIGHENDPGVDITSIAIAFGIPTEFPEKVLNQAEGMNKPVSEADMAGRTDLRDTVMVTIDGEDAKDLDDAVSLKMDGDKYVLGVHIADVANYVQENSALDREALKRGTSVYLADRVVPMLPHALSNGICSLNEGVDRLSMSVIMTIDSTGKTIDYDICESVVNINHRMSYTQVKKIIEDNDEETIKEYEDVAPMLQKMQELSLILRDRRHKRGAIDFDFPETKLILNKDGEPIEIKPYERNEATKLIESFMLAANETVAEHFYWKEVPFLYRIHENPDEEKVNKLRTFIKNFGYSLKINGEDIHPKEFQKLLSKIEGSNEEPLISRLTLRSMQQAKYSTECEGHFGLACKYYSHFTSPIRRYPDLQIHRIIKDDLRNRMTDAKKKHYEEILPGVAVSTSKSERRADETERETVKLKKAQYMIKHINEIFEGVISGVTNWGIYVELENTVEGLVHVSSLKGFYRFDEAKYELVSEDNDTVYKLGEKVKVMVKDVDLSLRTVDFIIADFDVDDAIHDFYKKGRR
ncbi:MAG: ribonuclease R [Lachnospiraceae bacterium]|nr:ribonuclease R [Lachnospiraceae bacterium]